MKNFSELLATELHLNVSVNGKLSTAGLLHTLEFNADSTVSVDDIEVLPKYRHLSVDGLLTISEPFYCWYHRASGQGWLLTPH